MNLLPYLSLLILAVSSVKVVLGEEYPECNDVKGYMYTFEDAVKEGKKTVSCNMQDDKTHNALS